MRLPIIIIGCFYVQNSSLRQFQCHRLEQQTSLCCWYCVCGVLRMMVIIMVIFYVKHSSPRQLLCCRLEQQTSMPLVQFMRCIMNDDQCAYPLLLLVVFMYKTPPRDSFCAVDWSNKHLYAVGTVYAVYYE